MDLNGTERAWFRLEWSPEAGRLALSCSWGPARNRMLRARFDGWTATPDLKTRVVRTQRDRWELRADLTRLPLDRVADLLIQELVRFARAYPEAALPPFAAPGSF